MSLPCRSLLFVPADNPKLLAKAHQCGADAIILDLEDAVLPARKPEGRTGLSEQINRLHGLGMPVLVRINSAWRDVAADLEAAVHPGVTALMVPKVEDAGALRVLSSMVGEWETERGLKPGTVGLVALIESPLGLERMADIARAPRMVALALGGEDFSLALGVEPTEAVLAFPCRQVALTAAAHGLAALGVPGSLAEYRDLELYRALVAQARMVGMSGVLCIHPAQLAVVRDAFAPSPRDAEWANQVLKAWNEAQAKGQGATSLNGSMIDRPVVERAKAIMRCHLG